MFPEEVVQKIREQSPECFDTAQRVTENFLKKGVLLAQGRVSIDHRYATEVAYLDVISLWRGRVERTDHQVLLRLQYLTKSNMDMGEGFPGETAMNGTAIFVDGPMWENAPIQEADIVNQLALAIHDWKVPAWANPSRGPFMGNLVLGDSIWTSIPAHHPLLLQHLCLCLGSFDGSYTEKLRMLKGTVGNSLRATVRERALHSLRSRFGSFIAQARRESLLTWFGSP